MPSIVNLSSADDPRVADYQAVSDPELMRARRLFVAEGRLVVQRVFKDERYRIRSLFLTDASLNALTSDIAALPPGVPVYVGGIESFRTITGFHLHRGCLALVERPAVREPLDVVKNAETVVVLEDVTNPDNMGSVFRSAAAFGAGAVVLSSGCCDPLYRKAIRTSMGASLKVPFTRIDDWPRGLGDLRRCGFRIVALTPHHATDTVHALGRGSDRIAILAGTEGAGLTEAALALSDTTVRIPTSSDVDSLNVAVAVAIALHALFQRSDRSG